MKLLVLNIKLLSQVQSTQFHTLKLETFWKYSKQTKFTFKTIQNEIFFIEVFPYESIPKQVQTQENSPDSNLNIPKSACSTLRTEKQDMPQNVHIPTISLDNHATQNTKLLL